jgi:general secretion pathway protein B
MSYILDALKRADAERGRGAVPGLHTRQMASPAASALPSAGRYAGLAAVAVVALGGIAAGVWFWQMPARPMQLAAVEPAVAQPPVQTPAPEPAPLAGAAALPIPAPVVPSAPVTAPVPALKPAVAAPPRAVPSPVPVAPVAVQKTAPRPLPAPAVDMPAPPPKPRPDPIPVAKASPAPAAIPLLSELPDSIRRQLPPLAINGSVYSSNPGQRLLLVNNQVLPQGAQAAPEVTLEEIRPKSSVFSFRGSRFQLAH